MNLFNHKYRYLFIIGLGGYSYVNSLFSEVYVHYRVPGEWFDILLVFVLITGLVWEGNRIIRNILLRFFNYLKPIRFLALFFFTGMLFSVLASVSTVFIIGSAFLHSSPSQLSVPAKLAFTYGTRINLFLHILNAVFFYISQYKNKELEAEELKRIHSQAQLQAIKNQVNPHFLFNNLNVLSMLVMQENPDANKFIEAFAKVYRYVLNSQQQELTALRTELEFIKPYIFLLEKRFPESISISIDVPDKYESYYVVPVAVQMLIENAIKHNVVSRAKPLHVRLTVDGHGNLAVTNNLQPKPAAEPSTQIGLKNIAQRYEMITSRDIEVKKDNQQFSVLLPLIETAKEIHPVI